MRAAGFLFVMVATLLAGGAGRIAYIEYSQGTSLRSRAVRQHTSRLTIPAIRGEILDTKGRVLAGTVRRPSVFVDPSLIDDARFAAASVAPVLGLDAAALERTINDNRDRKFVWVKRWVAEEELEALNAVRRARRLRAFGVRYEPRRAYPFGDLAQRILGIVGADQKGLAGIEQKFDEQLRGTDGKRLSTVDVLRRPVRQHSEQYVPPVDGASVVLTIDTYIQQRTVLHLQKAVEHFKALWGVAVVMDPRSGEVLAMATAELPPLGDVEQPVLESLRNRAIADSYEPGSMFKPFVAAAAFDAGVAALDEPFAVNGPARQFGSRTMHDTHAYSTLTLAEIISKSSNIGMGLLADRCGNERLHEWVRRFGFGARTGIELPGEHDGQLLPLSRWTRYSTQSIPVGQEIAVTPIQMAAAFSALSNGGVLYRARIVRGVVSAAGETVADFSKPVVIRRVIREESASAFRKRALLEAVTIGTGKRAAIPDYQVYGKTGTAQVARRDGRGYAPGQYVGSFVGGAPADQPRAIAVVSLYRPSSGEYYGGTVAAPVVGAILADTLAYMQVPTDHERGIRVGAER